MQVLLPGEDVKFSSPADVGGGYEAFQYRTLLAVSASLGLPYHLVTGDVRQANYSSLRAELVEFRRRVGQLQHGVMVHQLCRPIWRRWLETAVLSGALDIGDPVAARPVQWIPPRWDWVDPLKDIQAQVLAMEAGITSRRKVVEATGYDVEEVDRENAADAKRAADLGLSYRTSPGETQGARATPAARPDPGDGTTRSRATASTRQPNRSESMASWYAIRARATGAEVAIYDEIGAYGVSAKGFLTELGALPEGTPVDLRLNSPGGSVFDAVAIHNALKRHEGTVTVWIDGIAASAASYVAMAGDEIVMPENAFLMIHDPSGLVMGTAGDMRAMAEALEKVKGGLVQGYAAKSGRTPEEVSALMSAETWLDAADALAQGFADRLIEPVRIAARFDIGRFRNAPPELVEAVEGDGTDAETVPDGNGSEATAADIVGRRRRCHARRRSCAAVGDRGDGCRGRTTSLRLTPIPRPALRPPTRPRTPAPSAPRPSPMPAPSSISAASRASRRWPAASSSRTRASTRCAPRSSPRRPRPSPRSRPHHPQPGRPSAARPWGEIVARTFKLKG